jgi:hypothetical protein
MLGLECRRTRTISYLCAERMSVGETASVVIVINEIPGMMNGDLRLRLQMLCYVEAGYTVTIRVINTCHSSVLHHIDRCFSAIRRELLESRCRATYPP